MSIRSLPAATVATRPAARTEAPSGALTRWNPGLRAAVDESADDGVIQILEVIGEDFWGEGASLMGVTRALREIGDRPVRVDINSPGGDYFEGLAIYNALREHKQEVTVNVLGMAASSASLIAMAGDTINVARAGFLMIHNTWVVAGGDRNDLREVADWLEPFDSTLADIYAARSGISKSDIAAMLDRETWLGGQQAVDQGFADGLLSSDQIADEPSASSKIEITLRKLDAALAGKKIPRSERRQLLGKLKELGGMQDAASSGTQDAAAMASSLLAELKALR